METILKDLLNMKGSLADERRRNGVKPVLGEGNLKANIVFVGEAPGKNEAKQGRPFCGASGKFLDVMLASIGATREMVYITNIVNDRPTDNRDPSEEEIKAYSVFLDRQLDIIKPKVIVTLGRLSMGYVMEKFNLKDEFQVISKIHGKVFESKAPWGKKIKIVPLYHPAVALYKGSNRAVLLDDFKVLKPMI